MNYKGIDKEKILEVQKVKLHNTDAYARFTEEELKEICKGTDSLERLYKGIENQLKARMNDTEMAIICEMAMMYLDSLKDKVTADKEAYNKGLNDAWELAKKIAMEELNGGFSSYDILNIFGYGDMDAIFMSYSPQEALAKFETYEKEQAEIKVGDVVNVKSIAGSEYIGIVTQITANQNCACIVYSDGTAEMTTVNNMTKTGKYLNIQSLLDELKKVFKC